MTDTQTTIAGGRDARVDALRAYWAASREADSLQQAAWENPTPETAFAALMARKNENSAFVVMHKTREASASPAKKKAAA